MIIEKENTTAEHDWASVLALIRMSPYWKFSDPPRWKCGCISSRGMQRYDEGEIPPSGYYGHVEHSGWVLKLGKCLGSLSGLPVWSNYRARSNFCLQRPQTNLRAHHQSGIGAAVSVSIGLNCQQHEQRLCKRLNDVQSKQWLITGT